MRALVTGAYGFGGSYLVPHLLEMGEQVLATYVDKPTIDLGCEGQYLDICDYAACKQIISSFKPDVVYNLAGIAFAPDCERNFDLALKVNVAGVHSILSACDELAAPVTFLQVSSSEVYGKIRPDQVPITEEAPVKAVHNYSLSKALSEVVVARFRESQNVKAVIVRAFNHIGPRQRPDFVVSNFAQQLAQMAKGKAESVMRVGNLEPKRDFADVRDVVRGYRLAALKGDNQQIYNLCSGNSVSIQTILDTLIEVSGLEVGVQQDPNRMRPSEVPEIRGSREKAKAKLGWEPEFVAIKESLQAVYRYWLERVQS